MKQGLLVLPLYTEEKGFCALAQAIETISKQTWFGLTTRERTQCKSTSKIWDTQCNSQKNTSSPQTSINCSVALQITRPYTRPTHPRCNTVQNQEMIIRKRKLILTTKTYLGIFQNIFALFRNTTITLLLINSFALMFLYFFRSCQSQNVKIQTKTLSKSSKELKARSYLDRLRTPY